MRYQPESTGAVWDGWNCVIHWTDSPQSAVLVAEEMLDRDTYAFVRNTDPDDDLPGVEWIETGRIITDRAALHAYMELVRLG